jgi:excisionase family DNA binding protein
MSTITLNASETLVPTEQESLMAKESSSMLAAYTSRNSNTTIQLIVESDHKHSAVALPASVFRLLLNILTQMSKGNAVSLIPIHAELSTQEAADLLNVSRPYLVKLLETKQMPYRKVGTHYRVLFQDLLTYKQQIDSKRLQTLEKLTEQAQSLNLGY